MLATSPNARALKAELDIVRARLRLLQKSAKRAKTQKSEGWRCALTNPSCLLVLVYSGGTPEIAADFAQGRGWWKSQDLVSGCLGHAQEVAAKIESVYDALPLSQIAQLHSDPVKAGLVTETQMLTVLRWLVERFLYFWIEEQNAVHGVAPSRAQLVDQAVSAIPPLAPDVWKQKVRLRLAGSQRCQRRWLAKFRRRWGLRLGKLKTCNHLSVAEKQSKACLGEPFFGSVWKRWKWECVCSRTQFKMKTSCNSIFGCVWRCRFWSRIPCQALAYFQWINAASAAAPPNRPALLINMDETALVRHASGLVGTVLKDCPLKLGVGDFSSLGQRRSHITYLATITHDAEVQLRLPQVLIGNEHQFPASMMKSLPTLPPNVHVWRCKSAWNSHALMRRYLSLLASSLGSILKDRCVILILDVARCHIHPTILAHAKRYGIQLVYVPALMTAELQPCDAYLFWQFKAAFRNAWRREKSNSDGGWISARQWLEVAIFAIEAVLPTTDWEVAFAAVGAVAEQSRMSVRLCHVLGWDQIPTVPEGWPSLEAAKLIFPKNLKVNLEAYVGRDSWRLTDLVLGRRRRPLPVTFIGTMERPLTID